ncbi:MAG TPA: cellulase family glycosylhydrolase [Steroidobacteraceae bacterium]|nr:cellulase family glycosylhydrolase [Steroidobacteraceae bacterium]
MIALRKRGLYVILVLNYSAPNDLLNQVDQVSAQCATDFNPLPDRDHAIDFWTQLASEYKTYPNVLFELFDNPYIDEWRYFKGTKADAWKALRDGIAIDSYKPLWPTKKRHTWQSVGMQEILNEIRHTGARNIILQCGLPGRDLDLWLTYKSIDPINQTAAAWHAFPSEGSKWGDECYSHPSWCDDRAYSFANNILSQGYPVVVTQFADSSADGTTGAPFASTLLQKLDAMGISYLAWMFKPDNEKFATLIKEKSGTPTDGYGEYVKAHYACAAGLKNSCLTAMRQSQSSSRSAGQESSQPNVRGWIPSTSPI